MSKPIFNYLRKNSAKLMLSKCRTSKEAMSTSYVVMVCWCDQLNDKQIIVCVFEIFISFSMNNRREIGDINLVIFRKDN